MGPISRTFLVATGLWMAMASSSSIVMAQQAAAPQGAAPPKPPEAKPPEARQSYALQVVLPTIVLDALILPAGEYYLHVFAGRALAGPLVHVLHRRPVQALASLALEGLLPLAAGGAGLLYLREYCAGYLYKTCVDAPIAIFVPAFIAGAAGTVLDATLLANEPVTPEPPKKQALSFAPYVAPQVLPGARKGELRSAWTVGLVGRF